MANTKDGVGKEGWAYTPSDEVSTWKLNISDARHVSAAVAALGKGFRGNKVQIPEADMAAVKKKVATAYRKFFPDNEVPNVLKALDLQINGQEVSDEGLFQRLVCTIADYFRGKEWMEQYMEAEEQYAEEALQEEGMLGSQDESFTQKSLNEELKQATFIVLEPNSVDLHGDTYSEAEVRKACHNFNQFCRKAYLNHDVETDKLDFVESYIVPDDVIINDFAVKKGTWLAVAQFNDDELWQEMKADSNIGLSIAAFATVEEIK